MSKALPAAPTSVRSGSAPGAEPTLLVAAPNRGKLALLAIVIFAATLLTYWPVLRAGFIWDDNAHVTAPGLRSWDGLARIWTEPRATQQYYPLLHSAFWLEHRWWGGNPKAYHLCNLVLHATGVWLLAWLLLRLAVPGALLAAGIFALHPLQVESVAWISEQKNTLSAIFYFAAALAYLDFNVTRRRGRYLLALTFFACALLTKTVTATLPAALLVVLWWKRGALDFRRDVAPLLPWFLLGLVAGIFTAWVERKWIGAEGAVFDLSFLQRTLLAGRIAWFYALKLIWPENLSFIYPRWEISPAVVWHWLPLLAALTLIAGLWMLRHRARGPLAACLFFGGTLFPALGFFNVYPFKNSFVADHFQHLGGIGLIVLGAAGATLGLRRFGRAALAASLAILLGLGLLARHQTHDYLDAETLYRRTIARNPAAWMAHNNLGEILIKEKGRQTEAIALFERAIALWPAYFEAHNNLGLALAQSGRPREALGHLESAIKLRPDSYQAHNNMAIALVGDGQAAAAADSFATAARLNPTLANIRENWAKMLQYLGRSSEAAAQFAEAARLREATK